MKKFLRGLALLSIFALGLFGAAFAVLPLPGTVPVLMYHFIGTKQEAAESKNFVTAPTLHLQMEFLRRFGYHVISLDDYYQIRTGQKKPRGRQIVLSFDDGNVSFQKEAFGILQPYAFPVTLFIVSESVKRELNASMSEKTIKELLIHPWISIAGHTKTHPLLSELNEEQLRDELAGSKKDLEEMFGRPIRYVAYPSGDITQKVMDEAERAGYLLGFTTSHKKLKKIKEGPYAATRVKVSETSENLLLFWIEISGLHQIFKGQIHRLKS